MSALGWNPADDTKLDYDEDAPRPDRPYRVRHTRTESAFLCESLDSARGVVRSLPKGTPVVIEHRVAGDTWTAVPEAPDAAA